MNLSRLSVGSALILGVLTAWIGACSSNSATSCGIGGLKNGTCQAGPTCATGSALIPIVDPFDMCPTTYVVGDVQAICCSPAGDSGMAIGSNDSGPGRPDATMGTDAKQPDAGTDATGMDVTTPPADVTTPPADTGMDVATPPADSGHDAGMDTGAGDSGHDAGMDTGPGDAGHDSNTCGAAAACSASTPCAASATLCVVPSCTMGCCTSTNAAAGTTCTDNGTVCDGNGKCVAANGAACTTTAQCASGNCANGVCCNTACNAPCEACSAALTGGADGTCGPLTSGAACAGGVCTGLGVGAAACVQCVGDVTCPGGTPVCSTATNSCVQCTATNATACSGSTPACNVVTNTCGLATGGVCANNSDCASDMCVALLCL